MSQDRPDGEGPGASGRPSGASGEGSLALFHLPTCPFCWRVRWAAYRLGVSLELLDIGRDPALRDELLRAREKKTVPVLRIPGPGGPEYLPESGDIVAYLQRHFG